jgi:hypothetical protein
MMEQLSGAFFQRWGLLITACALIFSISGMWAGLVRLGDLDHFAIGGMIQFNDAAGHLTAAHDQAKDGVWQSFALRHPIAAAFRSTLLFFAGFSLPGILLLQAFLLVGAICFASAAVTRWRGLWPGVTFLAFTYRIACTTRLQKREADDTHTWAIPGSSHTPALGISSPGIDRAHLMGPCNHGGLQMEQYVGLDVYR